MGFVFAAVFIAFMMEVCDQHLFLFLRSIDAEGAPYLMKIFIYLVISLIELTSTLYSHYSDIYLKTGTIVQVNSGILLFLSSFNIGMWISCGVSGLCILCLFSSY